MPKRINNIFKPAITFNKILEAHNKTKKGKRFKKQVIEFEMNLESNIIQIGKKLLNRNYAQRGQSLKCKMHKRDTP